MKDRGASLIGRYIITDPRICHGKPTFRGTRILVADVLEQVASGMSWEAIREDWDDKIANEAIQEAVQLASHALLKHADEFIVEPSSRRGNVLDENVPASQREMLLRRRVRVRQIEVLTLAARECQDDEIIPLLIRLRRPTFFTRDEDFFDRQLCHRKYCLVYLDVRRQEVALFVRRLLAHANFNTQVKRMGTVVRVSHVGLSVWKSRAERATRFDWQ